MSTLIAASIETSLADSWLWCLANIACPYLEYCTVLHCKGLYWTELYCIALQFTQLYCNSYYTFKWGNALYSDVIYCTVQCSVLQGTALQDINLTSYLGPLIFEPPQTLGTDSTDRLKDISRTRNIFATFHTHFYNLQIIWTDNANQSLQ